MKYQYKVLGFVPVVKGCGSSDNGWDQKRCEQFQEFLNEQAKEGWRLQSSEYRNVTGVAGCLPKAGASLICIFEKSE